MRSVAVALRMVGPIATLSCVALSVVFLAGCGAAPGRSLHAESQTQAGASVSDADFARALRDLLLSEPKSRDRGLRLLAVEDKQMRRTQRRFQSRNPEAGVAAFGGGMHLLRTGELGDALLGAIGHDVRSSVAREFAKHGDEGRAEAVYKSLARSGPAALRADAKEHVDAINAWNTAAGTSPIAQSGALARSAVARYLYELTPDSRDAALQKTNDWLARGLSLRDAFRRGRQPPNRSEGNEALRAFSTAPSLLVALRIRDHDRASAMAELQHGENANMVRRELYAAVSALADKATAAHWLEVGRLLRPQPRTSEEEEGVEDLEVFRAAAFAAAIEAYRLEPSNPQAAIEVAIHLRDLGFAETAPAALWAAISAHPEPPLLNAAVAIVLACMETERQLGDSDAVRRTFVAGTSLLVAARSSKVPLPTAPARVLTLMGEVEQAEGYLAAARALLDASERENPQVATVVALARIDVHEGKPKAAIERLTLGLSRKGVLAAESRAELWLGKSDAQQADNDKAGARDSLLQALRELRESKGQSLGVEKERLYADIYERFGARSASVRALDRAIDAARDKRFLPMLFTTAASRAFVHGELSVARETLARAVAAELDPSTLVYCALWARILERQQKAATDIAAERLLAASVEDPRWQGRLAAFGLGQLSGKALLALAKTPAERTEAMFYFALEKRMAGESSDETLRQVGKESGVELLEYGMARALLPEAKLGLGPLPAAESL